MSMALLAADVELRLEVVNIVVFGLIVLEPLMPLNTYEAI